jgi:hypothetical protein
MDYSAAGLRDGGSSTTNSMVKIVGTPLQS